MFSRSKIFVLLAAGVFTLAAFGAKAQRPIDVTLETLSPVDLCGSDSSFILTCSVGSLAPSDSVLLYDITLSYPTDKVSYSQVLFSNTLSEGLETKDYNAKTPGELRVYGFNVVKPIVGSKVLFAVLFTIRSSCTDTTTIGFAALPEVNPEAHVFVRTLNSVTVPTMIADLATRSLNIKFSNDTIVFTKSDQSHPITCLASTARPGVLQYADIEVQVDKTRLTLNGPEAVNAVDTVLVDSTGAFPHFRIQRKDGGLLSKVFGFKANAQLKSTGDQQQTWTMPARLVAKSSCACVTRDSSDTLIVVTTIHTDGVQDTDSEWLTVRSDGDVWELYNSRYNPVTVTVYSALGEQMRSLVVGAQQNGLIDSRTLPNGVYFLHYRAERDCFKKQLKFN